MGSREVSVWAGAGSTMVLESDPRVDGRDEISISSVSCHVVRTGCSKHS